MEKGKSENREENQTDVLFQKPREENLPRREYSVITKAAESLCKSRLKHSLLDLRTWRSQVTQRVGVRTVEGQSQRRSK